MNDEISVFEKAITEVMNLQTGHTYRANILSYDVGPVVSDGVNAHSAGRVEVTNLSMKETGKNEYDFTFILKAGYLTLLLVDDKENEFNYSGHIAL